MSENLPAKLTEEMTQALPKVLEFWFNTPAHRKRWFVSNQTFDSAIRSLFGDLLHHLGKYQRQSDAAGLAALAAWPTTPAARLGFIVLCDQFPRNIYRGNADAFSLDDLAKRVSSAGIEAGDTKHLDIDASTFFCLPFEHSESLLDQHTSVGLLTQLRDNANGANRVAAGSYLRHAHQHRDIIARFGRFPHRNLALGRESTTTELAFIANGNNFSQGQGNNNR